MSNDRYKEGLKIRREVVGAEQVDRWLAESDEFTAPLEELIIEYGWGAIWSRPGLDRRTRSFPSNLVARRHGFTPPAPFGE